MTSADFIIAGAMVAAGSGLAVAIQAVINLQAVRRINQSAPFLAFKSYRFDALSADLQFQGCFSTIDLARKAALAGADYEDDCRVFDSSKREWIDAKSGEILP